jgi:hypothetical protein
MAGTLVVVSQNQFGEQSVNRILPGSSAQIDCNFIVDSTNGNGLGIRSLKGDDVGKVFMHTSATPAGGNPNPIAGVIMVQLKKAYQAYLGGYAGAVSPVTGGALVLSAGNAITAGHVYVIVGLGTTTTVANWLAAGLPAGVTAAVGAAFVATAAAAAGTGLGDATVMALGVSGIDHVEVLGDANTELAATNGSIIFLQCLAAGSLTAPTDGTVVGLRLVMAS